MKKIKCINGKITIPDKYQLSKENRKLRVKMPWVSWMKRLCKDNFTVSTQMWFRTKKLGDKPFLPEGFIEINGERFKVEK